MNTTNSYSNNFYETYEQGGPLRIPRHMLFYSAAYFLSKAKIFQNLDSTITITKVLEKAQITAEEQRDLFYISSNYYDFIIDDMLIASAFEHYAKSMLLVRRYIPHVIVGSGKLKKRQGNEPIHFRTYRSMLKKDPTVNHP